MGRRGYWVAKREDQVSRRPNVSKGGSPTVRKDSNSRKPRGNRVKFQRGGRIWAGHTEDQPTELLLEPPQDS